MPKPKTPTPKRRAQAYDEGDVFGVPLSNSRGWALGIVARHHNGLGVAYFFGPQLSKLPAAPPCLSPEDTIAIIRCSDMALSDGSWPVIGKMPRWRPAEWPIIETSRVEPISDRAFRVRYLDADLDQRSETPTTLVDAARRPRDGFSGSRAVENKLTRLVDRHAEEPLARFDWVALIAEARDREAPPSPLAPGSLVSRAEHALLVHIPLSNSGFGTREDRARDDALEQALTAAVEAADAGKFDGTETGVGETTFFLYGPDADRLFAVVEPVLGNSRLPQGSFIVKRYGPPREGIETQMRL